jgi:hypothetical protein
MTTRPDMVREIKIAARVSELRRLAADTAENYGERSPPPG